LSATRRPSTVSSASHTSPIPPTPIRPTRQYRPLEPSEPTGPAIVRLPPHASSGGLRRQPGPEPCQVAALTTATSLARAWMKSAPCPL
jgi:hypothetical protein